ncbi:hypothetical protein D3C78_1683420 [compost metagenome]
MLIILRIITTALSKIGTPSERIGISKENNVAPLKAPSNAIIPSIKPRKEAPASPINTRAGGLL